MRLAIEVIVLVCRTVDDLRWSLIYQMSEDIRVQGLLLGRLGRCKYGWHLDVNIVPSLTLKARRIGFEETQKIRKNFENQDESSRFKFFREHLF